MSWPVLLLLVPEAVCHGVWRDGGHIQHSLGDGTGLCVGADRGGRPQFFFLMSKVSLSLSPSLSLALFQPVIRKMFFVSFFFSYLFIILGTQPPFFLLFQHSALFPLHAIHLDSILFAITSVSSLIEFLDVRFNRLVLFDCSCSVLSPPTFPYPSVLSIFLLLLFHAIFPIQASVRNIWCLPSLQIMV